MHSIGAEQAKGSFVEAASVYRHPVRLLKTKPMVAGYDMQEEEKHLEDDEIECGRFWLNAVHKHCI